MSTLQFFDLFRAFVGEIESRNLPEDQRQRLYDSAVVALKDILAGGPPAASSIFSAPATSSGAQQSFQPQQQTQSRPQQQQQQPSYQPQQQQAAPPPQAAPQAAASASVGVPTMKANDPASRAMLRAMNDAAYAANGKLTNTYKNMVGNAEILNAELLAAGFAKLGVHCSVPDMGVIIAPFATKSGEVNYGAFVRMLGAA